MKNTVTKGWIPRISYLFPGNYLNLSLTFCVHWFFLPLRKLRWFSSIWLTWWIQTWLIPGLVEWRVYLSRLPLDDLEVSVNLQGSSAFSSRPNQLTCSNGGVEGEREKKLKRWIILNTFIWFNTWIVADLTVTVAFFSFIGPHLPWCCSWRGSPEWRSPSFCLRAHWKWLSAQTGRLASLSSWTEVLHLGLKPWRCLGGAICLELQFYPEEDVEERGRESENRQWRMSTLV